MFKTVFTLLFVIINVQCRENDGVITFESEVFLEIGDACISTHNGVEIHGVCTSSVKCPSMRASLFNQKSYLTVCGYENKTQIICCPTPNVSEVQTRQVTKLNLAKSLECIVANSNETGILQFLNDCPELNKNDATRHTNTLCTDDLCSDLVCCPAMLRNRLKNVCWYVNHPIDTLHLRLLLNQECTVKDLNIKGRFQSKWSCDFAKRNPNLVSVLNNVCNDNDVCDGWYCCPIEDSDTFGCTGNQILRSTATLVGPKCIDSKSGRQGTCRQKYNCPQFDVLTLDECGSYCCEDYFCCPDDVITINQLISSRECESYTKYFSKQEIEVPMNVYINRTYCTRVAPAGGVIANPGEFPHMAALGYKSMQEIVWNCGGSLISNRYVLTAGHCLTDQKIGSVQRVRLGVVNLLVDVDTYDCPEDFNVARVIPHPEYNPRFVYNDIGLIELGTQVQFNYHIRPICLPLTADASNGYVSMGWGATGYGENSSVRLIKVKQELFTYEECHEQYDINRRYPSGIMNSTQICAGSSDSIQSTCPGDSGGPLIVQHNHDKSIFFIHGIVSFGTACGFPNSPGVYTRVLPYVKWIEETVWKN